MAVAACGDWGLGTNRLVIASMDQDFCLRADRQLHLRGWEARVARSGAALLELLETQGCQMVLLDRLLPDLDADEVRRVLREMHPEIEVAYRESAEAARLLATAGGAAVSREPGAEKRAAPLVLLPAAGRSAAPFGEASSAKTGAERQVGAEPLPGMVGGSEAISRVYRLARLVAPRDTTVLITGETGTGKELVARAIHRLGPRAQRSFVVVNCAAIPEPLLEAELFGYTRGAFTGAVQSRLGRIHSAHGGTLFLDEVGDLPGGLQAKLLRFLQDGEVQRLGSADVFRVDVRVIAATNADLRARVASREFREDLYYRLAVFPIHVPPLRERVEDIFPLACHTLTLLCRQSKIPAKSVPPDACSLLCARRWPGNVRELQHALERALILAGPEQALRTDFFPSLD